MTSIADDPSQWMNVVKPKAKAAGTDDLFDTHGMSEDALIDYHTLRYTLDRIMMESFGRSSSFARTIHSLAMGGMIGTKKRGCTK